MRTLLKRPSQGLRKFGSNVIVRVATTHIPAMHPDDRDAAILAVSAIKQNNVPELRRLLGVLDPFEFNGSDRNRFQTRRQFIALFSKCAIPSLGSDTDRRRAAYDNWHLGEAACKATNAKFANKRELRESLSPDMLAVLTLAHEEFVRILPKFNLQQIYDSARPGPGKTQGSVRNSTTSPRDKMFNTRHTATKACLPYVPGLLRSSWGRALGYEFPIVCVVNASQHCLVPKNYKTERSIALEPSMNTWLQLGCHEVLSRACARTGNSVRDQSRNGFKARSASLGGSCTIDLSNASDTISTGFVRFMFTGWYRNSCDPDVVNACKWLELLEALRCSHMAIKGTEVRLEKFSSMGNGYTFVLETMLFLACARACARYAGDDVNPTTYGDDIVAGWQSSLLLTELLSMCGFTVNTEKSYYFGPFRESCGMDWYNGSYCTPLYMRSSGNSIHAHTLMQLYNDASFVECGHLKGELHSILYERGLVRWVSGDVPPTAGLQSNRRPTVKWCPWFQTWVQKAFVARPVNIAFTGPDDEALATSLLTFSGRDDFSAPWSTAVRGRLSWATQRVPLYGSYRGPVERKLGRPFLPDLPTQIV